MQFDAKFANEVLLPLNKAAYQLSWGQEPTVPGGWEKTAIISVNPTVIDKETAQGLGKVIVCENTDWGIVARKDDVSVIAIRGTDTEHQWLDDFTAIAQPVPHERWWMHRGFDDVWRSISSSAEEAWNIASSAKTVYITGHSLGAALALIMGVQHPEAICWTFAGPAVYSPVNGLPPWPNGVRVVNPRDLVPKVPVPPLYEHVGTALLVDGAADPLDFARQHSLDTYSAGLQRLIGQQVKAAGLS